MTPWSVRPRAGMPSSAARSAIASILQAPSSSEYSLWACRWTAVGVLTGRDRSCQAAQMPPGLRRANFARAPGFFTADPRPDYDPVVIYLLRHGEAEDGRGKPDSERELTSKGREQSRAAGRALAALDAQLEACISSPKSRARETAALACEALEAEVELSDELRGGPFDPLAVAAGRGNVLLVGHEPDFSAAVAAVTGAQVKLKKGGLAVIDGRLLIALLRPAELRAIAG